MQWVLYTWINLGSINIISALLPLLFLFQIRIQREEKVKNKRGRSRIQQYGVGYFYWFRLLTYIAPYFGVVYVWTVNVVGSYANPRCSAFVTIILALPSWSFFLFEHTDGGSNTFVLFFLLIIAVLLLHFLSIKYNHTIKYGRSAVPHKMFFPRLAFAPQVYLATVVWYGCLSQV